jgi:hypothetical protein
MDSGNELELLRDKVQEAEAKKDKTHVEKDKAKSEKDKAEKELLPFDGLLKELQWCRSELQCIIEEYRGKYCDHRFSEKKRELEQLTPKIEKAYADWKPCWDKESWTSYSYSLVCAEYDKACSEYDTLKAEYDKT